MENIPERLRVADFECRRLVCATNAQLVAERHLISSFHPAWNYESKICYGISKHGDAATTRRNNKSPWDVLHPGRDWAVSSPVRGGMNAEKVKADLDEHFRKHPPVRDEEAIMEIMLDAFRQVGKVSAEISTAAEHTDEVEEAMAHDNADRQGSESAFEDGEED